MEKKQIYLIEILFGQYFFGFPFMDLMDLPKKAVHVQIQLICFLIMKFTIFIYKIKNKKFIISS